MRVIDAKAEILYEESAEYVYKKLEEVARNCYQSAGSLDFSSIENFIRGIMQRKHWGILEHAIVTLKLTVDRGITHETVRHREASYAQESTRYCNYAKDKFGSEITAISILPGLLIDPVCSKLRVEQLEDIVAEWTDAMEDAERHYMAMLELGCSPQMARGVLPNSLKSAIDVTMNFREWRYFFEVRLLGHTGTPHPQMIQIASKALQIMYEKYPLLFSDIVIEATAKGVFEL